MVTAFELDKRPRKGPKVLHTTTSVAAFPSPSTSSTFQRKKFSMADGNRDYINEFNTVGQNLKRRKPVQYEFTSEGPQHDERWFATVYLSEEAWAKGTGRTLKRAAQADAARNAMALVQRGF
ncbi:hypothetical protein LshimejAT787_0300150 [Lyophyllum shimeji]|uniref:DRBM domain-containing protein n=1 Tax=Lyophyllum shimeji TaxID=47721 RepID=A0A9P3UJS9_LYOSH|nr:hypothetical protein LshimejAT787_0300150 [Lyophyllum shimeji]